MIPFASWSHSSGLRAEQLQDLVGEGVRPQGEDLLEDGCGGDGRRHVGHQVDHAERLGAAHLAVQEDGEHHARRQLHGHGAEGVPDRDAQRVEDLVVPLGGEVRQRHGETRAAGREDDEADDQGRRTELPAPADEPRAEHHARDGRHDREKVPDIGPEQLRVVPQPDERADGFPAVLEQADVDREQRRKQAEDPDQGDGRADEQPRRGVLGRAALQGAADRWSAWRRGTRSCWVHRHPPSPRRRRRAAQRKQVPIVGAATPRRQVSPARRDDEVSARGPVQPQPIVSQPSRSRVIFAALFAMPSSSQRRPFSAVPRVG